MPDGDQQQGQDGQGTGEQQGRTPEGFEAWLGKQDETVKGLINTHITGLKTALESERGTRKDLERQVRDLAGKAEKGSEAQQQLTALADKLSAAEKRVGAYDTLSAAGCSNLRLAYLAAADAGLIDGQGNVNVEKLKQQAPELFAKQAAAPKGNAGAGAGQAGQAQPNMNDFIRRAAGR